MKCYNRNTAEYKALQSKFDSSNISEGSLVVDSIIYKYQIINKTEDIPTISDAEGLLKSSNTAFNLKKGIFASAILNNLSRKRLISKLGDGYYVNNSNSLTRGYDEAVLSRNKEKIYSYLDINNISADAVTIERTKSKISLRISVNKKILTSKDLILESRDKNGVHIADVIQHMGKMFPGLEVDVTSIAAAKEYYDTIPNWQKKRLSFNQIKSYYVDGQVKLIEGRVTIETAIEEMLHPFMAAIAETNKTFYSSLLKESKENFPELNQLIEDSYTEKRGFTRDEREMELVTQALSRYFKKEYETTPTSTWKELIQNLLDWLFNIINDLHIHITGKNIPVSAIKDITLSDVARLLNTEDISFNLGIRVPHKVKYSLSPEKQQIIDKIMEEEANDIQKKTIIRMFHLAIASEKEIGVLTASIDKVEANAPLVILNEKDHRYYELQTGEEFQSVTKAIKGEMTEEDKVTKKLNLDIGNDFDAIAEGLAAGLTYDEVLALKDQEGNPRIKIIHKSMTTQGGMEIPNALLAYQQLQGHLTALKRDGAIMIPQVILPDWNSKIAGTADILIINKVGHIGIIDLKTGKTSMWSSDHETQWPLEGGILKEKGVNTLSTKQHQGIQVNVYRRIVENMGYEVMDVEEWGVSTLHILVDIRGKGKEQTFHDLFKIDGYINHAPSESVDKVNMIVPPLVDEVSKKEIDKMAEDAKIDNPVMKEGFLEEEEAHSEDNEDAGTMYDVLLKAVNDFSMGLIKQKEAVNAVTSDIFLDKTKKERLIEINHAQSMIRIAMGRDQKSVEVLFGDLVRNSLKEIKEFTKYIENPANFNKREYVTYVNNMDRFIETYRGLYAIKDHAVLNDTQLRLVGRLQGELNNLIGIRGGRREDQGIIDDATDNFVRNVIVTNTTNEDLTDEDIDEIMVRARDMSTTEFLFYDEDTSSDTILALMKKLYKRGKLEVLDAIDKRNNETRKHLARLIKLSNKKKIDYSFMLPSDGIGYIREIGYDYWGHKQELTDALFEDDVKLEYVFIDDLQSARPEDIEHNKRVYKAKRAYADFMQAEKRTNEGYEDGMYRRLNDEFQTERAKFEIYETIGRGHWRKRKGIGENAYSRYRAKYYEVSSEGSTFPILDSENEFTGMIKRGLGSEFPKIDYIEIRGISAPSTKFPNGKDMRDPKWVKLMDPKTALEQAQKDFYLMFMKEYEGKLLEMLPMSVRDNMLGKLPLNKDLFYETLRSKPDIITRWWARTTRTVKELFTTTGVAKKVMTDIHGNFIDTLPLYYVGNVRSEKALKRIEEKIIALTKSYNKGGITELKYLDQRRDLKNKRSIILAQPDSSEISKDVGDSLLRFSAMAENYQIMGALEDTLKAMIKVLEKREYTSPRGTQLFSKVKGKMREIGGRGVSTSGEKLTVSRAKKFMHMTYYDNDKMTRNFWDKVVSGLIRYSSLSYVAFNVFGNINNYTIARINNTIESMGSNRFFLAKAMARSVKEFQLRALPDIMRKTAFIGTAKAYEKYKPQSKYEVMVDLFRMMDKKTDIRETQAFDEKESWLERGLNWGYILNDSFEYNVQTKIGNAILMSQQILNTKTGITKSLYDAYSLNKDSEPILEEGYDMLLNRKGKPLRKYNTEARYDIRNYIREVNKQIHGNYAYEDRMVIQSHTIGQLAAQFHKWVVPAIKARLRPEYFDENLGWMEGRYRSMWSFIAYVFKHIKDVDTQVHKRFIESIKGPKIKGEMKMLNVYRTSAEIALTITVHLMSTILQSLFDDDDDTEKSLTRIKAENALLYQADRAKKEMVMFLPWPSGLYQVYQMVKTPIASTRTLGELAEAIDASGTWSYGKFFLSDKEFRTNSEYTYQRGWKKGQTKVTKQWWDAIPILYSIQRWQSFANQKDFHIK